MTDSPTPAIGRVVHYVARGSADGAFPPVCRAATITEVDPITVPADYPGGPHQEVGAAVMNPTGFFFHSLAAGGLRYDPGDDDPGRAGAGHRLCDGLFHAPGSWHWPGRV